MFDPTLAADPTKAIRSWLYSICERQAANYRRNRLRRRELLTSHLELDETEARELSGEEQLILEERRVALMAALDELEPQRRAVLVAYELEDIPMAEIAIAFSVPINTAWNRLRLAREDLRAAWSRMEARRRSRLSALPFGLALAGGSKWSLGALSLKGLSGAAKVLALAKAVSLPSLSLGATLLIETGRLALGGFATPSQVPDPPAILEVTITRAVEAPRIGVGEGPEGAVSSDPFSDDPQ